MRKLDRYEREIPRAYEKENMVSVRRTKAQLAAFRDAARTTFIESDCPQAGGALEDHKSLFEATPAS